jgi:ABC-type nitrate/sulfonate/bicarbonate transport system substrate-binding protein
MKKLRKMFAIALVAVLCLSTAACGKATDASSTTENGAESSQKLTSISVSGQPYSHTLPAWLGERDGLFEKADMGFKMIMFTGGAAQNEALGANEWDVGTMGSPPAVTGGVHYGVHVIGFGSPDDKAVTIWARSDSDVAKVSGAVEGYPNIKGNAETWKGKTILCPTSTSAHFTLIATLKAMGLTTNDVQIIDMGVAQGYTAFKAGQADIVCLWDPQGFDAEGEDWTCVSSGEATYVKMPTVIVASEKAIKEKHDEILQYLDIYYQESEKYSKDVDTYAKMLQEMGTENGVEQSLEIAKKCAEKRPLPTLDDEIDWFSGQVGSRKADTVMQNLMDFFVYTGTIEQSDKEKLINSDYIDSSFIKELAERYNKTLN